MFGRAAGLPRLCLRCQAGCAPPSSALRIRTSKIAAYRSSRRFASDWTAAIRRDTSNDPSHSGRSDLGSLGEHNDDRGETGKEKDSASVSQATERFLDRFFDSDAAPSDAAPSDNTTTQNEDESLLNNGSLKHESLSEENEPPLAQQESDDRLASTQHSLLDHQHLGIGALGRPLEAVVIKNPNQMRFPKRQVPTLEEYSTQIESSVAWRDLLPQEADATMEISEEARQNIEELRPSDTTVLREREFEKLIGSLVDGFTKEQLATFYSQAADSHSPVEQEVPAYPWVKKQTAWKAAAPSMPSKLKPKQVLAAMIMKEKWGLETLETREGVGATHLRLRTHTFKAVFGESMACVEALRNDLLDIEGGEDVLVNPTQNTVTLHVRRSSIAAILNQIDVFVNSQVTRKIPVGHLKPGDLKRTVLRPLERITGTALQVDYENEARPELTITWLGDRKQALPVSRQDDTAAKLHIEDPADMVTRLLDRQPRYLPCREVYVQMPTKNQRLRKRMYMDYRLATRSLSWRDRLRQWYRLTGRTMTPMKRKGARPRHMSSRLKLPQPPATIAGADTDNHLSATFGHILHTKTETDLGKLGPHRRTLCPVIPHPAALASISSVGDQAVAQRTAIILNFTAKAHKKLAFRAQPPDVQLRLPVEPDSDLANFSFPPGSTLHCVVPWYQNDVLMSDESVDVRLTQERRVQLDTTDIHSTQPSLQEFLGASTFDLLNGHLKTPSATSFNIPREWLSVKDSVFVENERISLDYHFSGLEIHQVVDMEWKEHALRYSSIEGGQHGGQRQELTIKAGLPAQHGMEPLSESQQRSFLKLVGDVAMGKYFSWDEGHKAMHQEVPRADAAREPENIQPQHDEAFIQQQDDAYLHKREARNAGAPSGESETDAGDTWGEARLRRNESSNTTALPDEWKVDTETISEPDASNMPGSEEVEVSAFASETSNASAMPEVHNHTLETNATKQHSREQRDVPSQSGQAQDSEAAEAAIEDAMSHSQVDPTASPDQRNAEVAPATDKDEAPDSDDFSTDTHTPPAPSPADEQAEPHASRTGDPTEQDGEAKGTPEEKRRRE